MVHKYKILLITCSILLIATGLFIEKRLFFPFNSKDKYRIAMAGRSVMEQWFKYWNWPSLIHKYAIWRPWPIPYKAYAKNGFYFEYVLMDPPDGKKKGDGYGEKMFESLKKGISGKSFDAIFFKLCFVDFDDNRVKDESSKNDRIKEMTSLVIKVVELAKQEHIKILLGNALPSLEPTFYGQQLRIEYNNWLETYATTNNDIIIVDLYGKLAGRDGKMEVSLALNPFDSHINRQGYTIIDKELFNKLGLLR
jgi:hypothetical protein